VIETRAPGKLFIAGEFAVVEPGEPAVLVAIDRFITVRLTPLTPGTETALESSSPHVRSAIEVVEQLRTERGLGHRPFAIEVESELQSETGQKYGLGSSAAVTVAVADAVSQHYGLTLDELALFRLSLLAVIELSPRASGGDLAASAFGGWISYTSPDRDALRAHRAAHGVDATLADDLWHGCAITRLPSPEHLRLLVGWTGSPASTDSQVSKVQSSDHRDTDEYRAFLARSRELVGELVACIAAGGKGATAVTLDLRELLHSLERVSGAQIETPLLGALCDAAEQHGAAGKPSGAGGGDCGIVLAEPEADTDAMLRQWHQHDIVDLAPTVCSTKPRLES